MNSNSLSIINDYFMTARQFSRRVKNRLIRPFANYVNQFYQVNNINKVLNHKDFKSFPLLPTSLLQSDLPLGQWMIALVKEPYYRHLVKEITHYNQSITAITSAEETAMLFSLIQYLRPPLFLEIGSFFCNTTRVLVEAYYHQKIEGKMITLDPFGNHRVPGILKSWPRRLQSYVTYYPWSSMQYFMQLDKMPKGLQSPLSLIFIDGNHSFEYALFDIIRSADQLTPGGAIVVDNLDQEGPKRASIEFLKWNPAWAFYSGGKLMNVDMMNAPLDWGVLISPPHIQVANNPLKLSKSSIKEKKLSAIRFNLEEVSHAGELFANVSYYSVPLDYHIKGTGITGQRQEQILKVNRGDHQVELKFDPPMIEESNRWDMNICYEIELSYKGNETSSAYILLNNKEPIILFE